MVEVSKNRSLGQTRKRLRFLDPPPPGPPPYQFCKWILNVRHGYN